MNEQIRRQIQTLSEQGEQARVKGRHAEAEERFDQAAELVPEPQERYPIYSWLLFSVADVMLSQGRVSEAFVLLTRVDELEFLAEQPEFHLLRGKCAQARSDEDIANRHLKMALKLGGASVFEGEHPRWLAQARGEHDGFQA